MESRKLLGFVGWDRGERGAPYIPIPRVPMMNSFFLIEQTIAAKEL